jgi:excisionase family DNA binding protein
MTYLNTAEAGLQLGVHSVTVRRMIVRRELEGFRVGRQFRTTQEAVDAYKAKSSAMAHSDAVATELADNATAIERLAEVLAARPKWLFDRAVPAPEGLEPLRGVLAGIPA